MQHKKNQDFLQVNMQQQKLDYQLLLLFVIIANVQDQ
eukprot:CAMPEP_0174818674 /NCGR_PEP_ID=MMETSP1107-20130205/1509_1 /TAXON_ID=36770 /ORGANISM="Paraphysomonas vestita, Strain GFlagA" /LENGTH=36 /DNA_ID= /DNA_START= /DNA_END= /DNA_ORIENTATION=